MNVALHNGKSGMNAFQQKMDVISNNIANVQTSGYKELNMTFKELLKDEIGELGTPLSEKLESMNPSMGSGVKAGAVCRDFEQGMMAASSNPIEIAIEGSGLFGFRDAGNNLLLSRVGNLSISRNGKLADQNGNELEIENGIDFSAYKAEQIKIGTTGEITVSDESGGTLNGGRIILYDAVNRNSLRDAGENYFTANRDELLQSGVQETEGHFGKILQGFFEMSNVDVGEAMVEMIVANRAYQFNAKSITAADEMWKMANNLTR